MLGKGAVKFSSELRLIVVAKSTLIEPPSPLLGSVFSDIDDIRATSPSIFSSTALDLDLLRLIG